MNKMITQMALEIEALRKELDSGILIFEAALLRNDRHLQEDTRVALHEKLDLILDNKKKMYTMAQQQYGPNDR